MGKVPDDSRCVLSQIELLLASVLNLRQFSIEDQILRRNVKRFRDGLVFKEHRRVYHCTLGSRLTKKKKNKNLRQMSTATC